MKTGIALGVLFIVALVGGYFFRSSYVPSHPYHSPQTATTTSSTVSTTSDTGTSTATGYTAADVAAHASSASCWTSINGSVYDLTSFISQHPGGEGAILSICGKDGSAVFNAQHSGNGRVESILATFKIGALAS